MAMKGKRPVEELAALGPETEVFHVEPLVVPDLSEERLDRQSLDFHRRVQQGYRDVAALEPERFRLIDGSGTLDAVAERVWAVVGPVLKDHGVSLAVCS